MVFLTALQQNLVDLVKRPKSHTPALDGFRALSILWVVALHVYWFTGLLVPMEVYQDIVASVPFKGIMSGSLGVDTFFVMSGFLIASQVFLEIDKTQTVDLKKFYLKRAFRLLPAYYLVLIVIELIIPSCQNVWANFLYVNNFLPVQESCMGWSWSLAIEEQFYLVFPVFAIWLSARKNPLAWLWGFLGLSFVINIVVFFTNPISNPFVSNPAMGLDSFFYQFNTFYNDTHLRFGALLMGILAAYINHYKKSNIESVGPWLSHGLGLAALAMIMVTTLLPSKEVINLHWTGVVYAAWYHYLFSAAVALLMILTLTQKGLFTKLNQVLSARVFYPIAQLSYSLYLVHPLVIVLTYRQAGNLTAENLPDYMWVAIALSIGVSAIMYVLIEKPFLRMRNHVISKKPKDSNKEVAATAGYSTVQ